MVRQLLRQLLSTDPELEAFCIDYFPEVQDRFTSSMERLIKVNLLLKLVEPARIYAHLMSCYGAQRTAQALLALDSNTELSQAPEAEKLADELEQLYRARARQQSAGLPTGEQDEAIRRIKRVQRQKPQLREGEVLVDRYRLEEIIGRGGFAKVWLAYDREARTFVAVKVLHSEQSEDQSRVARFRRGAQQLQRLHHPHLIRVLDGPAEESGFHFFVMAYIAHGDLHEAILKKRIDRTQALRAVLQTGEALEYAHKLGLIHRDVKPQNILLDLDWSARLTDFDLVLAPDSTGGTRTGAMGTFLYAAPEEQEDASRVDQRADVYSLAMTVMFVLHGKPLQHRAVLHRVLFIDALDCSESMRALLRSATAVDPDDRPATVAQFCGRLGELCVPAAPAPRVQVQPLEPARHAGPASPVRAEVDPKAVMTLDPDATGGPVPIDFGLALPVGGVRSLDEPSWQTPAGSAELVSVAPQARRSRRVYVAVTTGLLLLAGSGGLFAYVSQPPAVDPDARAATMLVEVENHLKDKRWQDAIEKSRQILSTPDVPQSRRDVATTKRHIAETEAKSKQIYDRFAGAAGTGNYDAAITTYRELPDTSVYKQIAAEDYDKVFPLFVENHLKLAAEARKQGNCPEARYQVQAVLDIDPQQIKAQTAKDLPCGSNSTTRPVVAIRDRGGSSKSQSDKGQPHSQLPPVVKPPVQREPVGTPTAASKTEAVKDDVSAADADAALTEAQTHFVNGDYTQAISQARQMTKASPVRAWRIIGGAACHLRDVKLANEAYRHQDAPGRQYMVYVCQREGMANQGNQFKLSE